MPRTARRSEPGAATDSVAARLLTWFDRHGRHDLPWQRRRTPYTVWVAEIMLQQTQVATVIPYFERFIERFPDVAALASSELDEVLALWSGLGYYARARNLHRTARIVSEQFEGQLPASLEALQTLPGIGRSTAGAILALAHDTCAPILDGNVKRVLARYHTVPGWPGETRVSRELWALAEEHTPQRRVGEYTQAIMDLGATVCTRGQPRCGQCPLHTDCRARINSSQSLYPAARPKRVRPRRALAVLVVRDPRLGVLLERRPANGIWGGLFSLPELDDDDTAEQWCLRRLGAHIHGGTPLATVAHSFTHFDLDLKPVLIELTAGPAAAMDGEQWLWYKHAAAPDVGIAAPIGRLLLDLADRRKGQSI